MAVSANESRKIMERIGFPQEAVDTIGDCTERVSENADFNALVDEFIANPENLDSVLERLKALSEQLGENEYTMNMCLLLGACPALRERYADHCLRIPMRAEARSLNLSNTAAILCYEALRQQNMLGQIDLNV